MTAERGRIGYLAGLAAEDAVARQYTLKGYQTLHSRWRCEAGEIDLIVERPGLTVFVEVKKSRDVARAAARISPRQIARIFHAAEIFTARTGRDPMADLRFDAAFVDGHGAVHILENALLSG